MNVTLTPFFHRYPPPPILCFAYIVHLILGGIVHNIVHYISVDGLSIKSVIPCIHLYMRAQNGIFLD